jgi:hypothetical protein
VRSGARRGTAEPPWRGLTLLLVRLHQHLPALQQASTLSSSCHQTLQLAQFGTSMHRRLSAERTHPL